MAGPADVVVRVAGAGEAGIVASLRVLWTAGAAPDPGFERRMAERLALEGARRTTWPALLGESTVGMVSLLEYRRMPRPGRPDSRWGDLSTMVVREEARLRGVGSALLATVVAVADERGYARLVLSPSARAVPLYRRATTACSSAPVHRSAGPRRTAPG